MGAGSSEVASQFQHTDLREGTTCGVPGTAVDIRSSHSGQHREGRAQWSLVSTTVYDFELKPSCRMHFDHSWQPRGKFSSVNP